MDILSVLHAPAVGFLDYMFYFLSLLVALTVIVFIHEYGHFKVARLCGVKVDVFSVGFGREVWGWTDSHQTRWKIGWLPLGGYVKFAGDLNAASMPDPDAAKRPPQPGDFHGMPVWKRALIVVAGPVANFILAAFLFIGAFYLVGDKVPGTLVGEVQAGSPAEQGGIKPGDIIKADQRPADPFIRRRRKDRQHEAGRDSECARGAEGRRPHTCRHGTALMSRTAAFTAKRRSGASASSRAARMPISGP